VIRTEQDVLRSGLHQIVDGLASHRVQLGLVTDGNLRFPPELCTDAAAPPEEGERGDQNAAHGRDRRRRAGAALAGPRAKPAGVLHVQHPSGADFDRRDRVLLESLAAQLSIVLENTRL
jgi:hypothetical protein